MPAILILIGLILIWLSAITGVGYGLFIWQSTTLAQAAWAGFLVFLKMLVGGYLLTFLGMFLKE